MIEFVTLFLGLVLGVREVALVVGDEVAAVEIRLNDAPVATLTGPPWTLLLSFGVESAVPGPDRLADAVAVAGLKAAELGHRRAVVLLLGAAPGDDPSQITRPQARRYLERLRVPFEVWSLGGEDAGPWGRARDVSTLNKLALAVRALARDLDRQRIVWVDGVHLPQEIALAPRASGLELLP
jgi:hypothetical protein